MSQSHLQGLEGHLWNAHSPGLARGLAQLGLLVSSSSGFGAFSLQQRRSTRGVTGFDAISASIIVTFAANTEKGAQRDNCAATMTSMRRFTCSDLFNFNAVNLDYFTETVGTDMQICSSL